MFDKLKNPAIQTIHQDFQVSYRYPVHFTRGLFDLRNPLFQDIIRADSIELPKKVLAVVDRGLYRHHPQLLEDIRAYNEDDC